MKDKLTEAVPQLGLHWLVLDEAPPERRGP